MLHYYVFFSKNGLVGPGKVLRSFRCRWQAFAGPRKESASCPHVNVLGEQGNPVCPAIRAVPCGHGLGSTRPVCGNAWMRTVRHRGRGEDPSEHPTNVRSGRGVNKNQGHLGTAPLRGIAGKETEGSPMLNSQTLVASGRAAHSFAEYGALERRLEPSWRPASWTTASEGCTFKHRFPKPGSRFPFHMRCALPRYVRYFLQAQAMPGEGGVGSPSASPPSGAAEVLDFIHSRSVVKHARKLAHPHGLTAETSKMSHWLASKHAPKAQEHRGVVHPCNSLLNHFALTNTSGGKFRRPAGPAIKQFGVPVPLRNCPANAGSTEQCPGICQSLFTIPLGSLNPPPPCLGSANSTAACEVQEFFF